MQRAAIVGVLSLLFFFATLIAFYIRQDFPFFLLATAFLIVYVFTMIGWWMQKRNALYIYDRGITYRKFSAEWVSIVGFESNQDGLTVTTAKGETATISRSIAGIDQVESYVRFRIER